MWEALWALKWCLLALALVVVVLWTVVHAYEQHDRDTCPLCRED